MTTHPVSTVRKLRQHLLVFGSDLVDLMQVGAMLQEDFACVSLIHTVQPLQRAAEEAADDAVGVVLLDSEVSPDEVRAALTDNPSLIFLTCDSNALAIEVAGGVVVSLSDGLLQATVTSFAAQLANPRVL